jgi:teichoic acid transport system permease protein
MPEAYCHGHARYSAALHAAPRVKLDEMTTGRVVRRRKSWSRDDQSEGLIRLGVLLSPRAYLVSLWSFRDFVRYAGLGRLRAEHQQTLLGGFWNLLNPLLQAAVYFLVFGVVFDARAAVDNYGAFLVIGLFIFVYTSRCVQSGAKSLTTNSALISQINFPRATLPAAAVVHEVAAFASALVVLVAFVRLTGEPVAASWLLLVPLLLLLTMFNLGLALFAARLSFHFRDLDNLLPHALRIWMYLSGVFFGIDLLSTRLGDESILLAVFQLNPAYAFINIARGALLASMAAESFYWLVACGWAAVALLGGFWFFRQRELDYGR